MSSKTNDEASVAHQLKLTDLIEDCLEHIFMYLDHEDLAKVADASKKLKPTAEIVFIRKYGKIEFIMPMGNSSVQNVSSLLLLRCFGHLITTLALWECNYHSDRYLQHLFDYILEYCTKSLTEVLLARILRSPFNSVATKPFLKVETLKIIQSNLAYTILKAKDLSAWFPAIRCLELTNVSSNCSVVEKHFPRLEHLIIYVTGKISIESIGMAFRLNPQLRRLDLNYGRSSEILRCAGKYLLHLDCLKLHFQLGRVFDYNGEMINFKTVKTLDICFGCASGQTMSSNQLSFDQLENLTLQVDNWNQISGLSNFFQKHQSITKVTFKFWFAEQPILKEHTSSKSILADVVQALPLLTELNVHDYEYSVDDLIDMINGFNLLKNSFTLKVPLELYGHGRQAHINQQSDDLKVRLGNKWQVTIDNERIHVERNV